MRYFVSRSNSNPHATSSNRRAFRPGRWFALAAVAVAALPGFAVERVLTLTAPETAVAGSEIAVAVTVSTNASDGEKIGFLHADYSIDGGVTWTNSWYAERLGVKETRNITFKLGPVGSKAAVRVRVAFRGGKAGDVDYTGKAIDWAGSWSSWRYPPAKSAHTAAIAAP